MAALVDLPLLRKILRVDFTDDDIDLHTMIAGASEDILAYLGAGSEDWYDSETDTITGTVPKAVVNATVRYVECLYDGADWPTGKGELPRQVEGLLYRQKRVVIG